MYPNLSFFIRCSVQVEAAMSSSKYEHKWIVFWRYFFVSVSDLNVDDISCGECLLDSSFRLVKNLQDSSISTIHIVSTRMRCCYKRTLSTD